jgi:hypothetical protein
MSDRRDMLTAMAMVWHRVAEHLAWPDAAKMKISLAGVTGCTAYAYDGANPLKIGLPFYAQHQRQKFVDKWQAVFADTGKLQRDSLQHFHASSKDCRTCPLRSRCVVHPATRAWSCSTSSTRRSPLPWTLISTGERYRRLWRGAMMTGSLATAP